MSFKEKWAAHKVFRDRFWWALTHIFDRTSYSPYIDEDNEEPGLLAKNRTGWEDLWHSLKNLWMEWRKDG